MTTVVDEQQCQWCGTASPIDAVRCDLCRLPFTGTVPPPRTWTPQPDAVAGSTPAAAPIVPKQQVTLAQAELELPAWLASLREAGAGAVPTQAGAPAQEQLPVYRGQPGDVQNGPGRRRRSRPLRRLMIWVIALGLLAAFLVLAPGRLFL